MLLIRSIIKLINRAFALLDSFSHANIYIHKKSISEMVNIYDCIIVLDL